MKFGPVKSVRASGAILAHSIVAGAVRLRKGHRIIDEDAINLLAAGVDEVVAAELDADDLDENQAAAAIATSMQLRGVESRPAATGRVNLHARGAGVFTVDAALVGAVNLVDPAVTLATLPNHAAVRDGQMVATVKIIPFAVNGATVEAVRELLASRQILAVHVFRPASVGIVQTMLPHLKASVLDKTSRVMQARLERSGSRVASELRVAHETSALAGAIEQSLASNSFAVVFGASAMSDFDDVIPAAIRAAGGTVIRAGMPVDPGNLIVLGAVGGQPVIGAPGCARSPRENGFDWVLDRLLAGLDVTADDIAGMGVGGLLTEIPTRPQPREAIDLREQADVGIVLLAAGQSSRMGGPNKLMALFDGVPLVRRVAERAVASHACTTVVVTGHQADRVAEALVGLDLTLVRNPDYARGLSTSLKAGVGALPRGTAAALIVLGDMPAVGTIDLDRMITAFADSGGKAIVRATFTGKRGNPVLLPRALFAGLAELEGDTGARHLVETSGAPVVDVEIGEGAVIDTDTPAALESAGGILQG